MRVFLRWFGLEPLKQPIKRFSTQTLPRNSLIGLALFTGSVPTLLSLRPYSPSTWVHFGLKPFVPFQICSLEAFRPLKTQMIQTKGQLPSPTVGTSLGSLCTPVSVRPPAFLSVVVESAASTQNTNLELMSFNLHKKSVYLIHFTSIYPCLTVREIINWHLLGMYVMHFERHIF